MSTQSHTATLTCAEAEHLLIRATYEDLPDRDSARMRAHVKGCDQCRCYHQITADMHQVAGREPDFVLTPDPAGRIALLARMHTLYPRRTGVFEEYGRRLITAIHRRIPVYQVVGGIAVFLVILFSVGHLPFGANTFHESPVGVADSMNTIIQPDTAGDSVRMQMNQPVDQHVGVDSSLKQQYEFHTI